MDGKTLDFGVEQFANGWMRGDLVVRFARNSLLGDFRSDCRRVWHDQSHDKFALIADDHGVENVRTRLQCVLDGLRRDEFPACGFD